MATVITDVFYLRNSYPMRQRTVEKGGAVISLSNPTQVGDTIITEAAYNTAVQDISDAYDAMIVQYNTNLTASRTLKNSAEAKLIVLGLTSAEIGALLS